MAAVQAEGHDGVRVMTVHAAKGLEFPVVAVPDLGRRLNAGHQPRRPRDRLARRRRVEALRDAARLPVATAPRALGAGRPEHGGERGRGRGGLPARLRRRLARPGPADPQRASTSPPTSSRPRSASPTTPRCGGCCRRSPSAASTAPTARSSCPAPLPVDGWRAVAGRHPSGDPDQRAGSNGAPPSSCARFPPPPRTIRWRAIPEPPPLLDASPGPVPIGHLSYSALAAVRALRLPLLRRAGARRARGARRAAPGEAADRGARGRRTELVEPGVARGLALGIGNAVHAALEWSARRGWEAPGRRAAGAPARPRGAGRDAGGAARAPRGWSPAGSTPSCAPSCSGTPRAEVPFVLDLGATVVRGQIDLLVERRRRPDRGRLQDRRARRTRAGRARRRATRSSARSTRSPPAGEPEPGRSTSSSRRPTSRVIEDFDAERLRAAREHLSALVERMRARRLRGHGEPLRGALLRLPGRRARPLPAADGLESRAAVE